MSEAELPLEELSPSPVVDDTDVDDDDDNTEVDDDDDDDDVELTVNDDNVGGDKFPTQVKYPLLSTPHQTF